MSSIQIVDVYVGNRVNFEQEVATGTDGVLIKLGQGQYQEYRAKKCDFIKRCEAAGLPWGGFWQMDARYSPESHKAAIKETFDALGFGKLELWLACEMPFYPCPDWMYNKMPYAYYKPIESVWRGIEQYTGKAPGFYSSASKWNLIFGKCPLALQQEFAAWAKKWVAQYKISKPDPWGAWGDAYTLWQYQENPDYSVFSGSEDEFRAMFGLGETPTTPPVEPPVEPPAGEKPKVTINISVQGEADVEVMR